MTNTNPGGAGGPAFPRSSPSSLGFTCGGAGVLDVSQISLLLWTAPRAVLDDQPSQDPSPVS